MDYICCMETKVIYTGLEDLAYPVGEGIHYNKPIIKQMIEAFSKLEELKNVELNLICRGSSGAIIATMFSLFLPNITKIVHIKKDGEDSHDSCVWLKPSAKNIIVDDFISQGNTLNAIYDKLIKVYDDTIIIDCVCVTGRNKLNKLKFRPKIFMCGTK
jgi:hypothetical protein